MNCLIGCGIPPLLSPSINVNLFIHLGINITFNTVHVISRRVVLWAKETSTYSWSRFCTDHCRSQVRNCHLSHIWFGVWAADLRGGIWVCYHALHHHGPSRNIKSQLFLKGISTHLSFILHLRGVDIFSFPWMFWNWILFMTMLLQVRVLFWGTD